MPAMPRYNSRSQLCPSRAILAHICGKWSVLILGLLAEDTKRFNELRRCVQGVTQKVLTQNLRELERLGLISRRIYAEVPPRVEYSLTPLGRSLVKVVDELRHWTDAHTGDMLAARQRYEQKQRGAPRREAALEEA
jgi:DNA-binding HxlR family transcriptional regulator